MRNLFMLTAGLLICGISVVRAQTVEECTPQVNVIPLCSRAAKGNAAAEDVLEGKTFSSSDEVNIPGTMINNGAMSFVPGILEQYIPRGFHDGSGSIQGDADLVSGNIRSGINLFGVEGSAIGASGTASADQVLAGQTFSNEAGAAIGTMPDVGAVNITPGTAPQSISRGYHSGGGVVEGDPDLVSSNIRSGINLFGVEGSAIEASGTASADQVLAGQTFSNEAGSAIGTMPDVGTLNITPGTVPQSISQGYHNGGGVVEGDPDLVSGNIRSGANIFGVAGNSNIVDTSSGDAAGGDLLFGKSAWVDGNLISGTIPTRTLDSSSTRVFGGYYNSTDLTEIDLDLNENNIPRGVEIFGISGSLWVAPCNSLYYCSGQVPTCTPDKDACANDQIPGATYNYLQTDCQADHGIQCMYFLFKCDGMAVQCLALGW